MIKLLDNEKTKVARQQLEHPSQGDAFAFGRAVGMYAGIEHVRNVLERWLKDEADRTNRL